MLTRANDHWTGAEKAEPLCVPPYAGSEKLEQTVEDISRSRSLSYALGDEETKRARPATGELPDYHKKGSVPFSRKG